MSRSLAIIGLCIGAAVIYGVAHDQVTARICIEYFTIGHPRILATEDATLHGLAWGVIATWWVGLLLGILLALAARVGRWPKLTAAGLVRPIGILLGVTGAVAIVAGFTGFLAARAGWVTLLEPLASRVPPDRHVAFLTDLWAHSGSYLAGSLGGLVLCVWVVIGRRALR